MKYHNGNANKMVSDTPRTDYAIWQIKGGEMVCPDFARYLERELNAANAKIKRLEEAGDAMEKYCRDYYASNQWLKAKEDKP